MATVYEDKTSEFFLDENIIKILLKDKTTKKNILWMTDNYTSYGKQYLEKSGIKLKLITGKNSKIIRPRIEKSKLEQNKRIRDKAEVFTPSWVCNKQNNLVDNEWFERTGIFNNEAENTWITNNLKIEFPEGKSWTDYVLLNRLEITCGEAPYLVSRYDTVSGNYIKVKDRIGMYDRKLRVISENTDNKSEWLEWAKKATQSIYGFEWQGDNLYLARTNIVYSYAEHYFDKFNDYPNENNLIEIAEIVSWNLWQMDGLKFVVPMSCVEKEIPSLNDLFGEEIEVEKQKCTGCLTNNIRAHNGIYCKIKDWKANKIIRAVYMLN